MITCNYQNLYSSAFKEKTTVYNNDSPIYYMKSYFQYN